MPLIEWQERFRIGIPSVDYEHQEMIALLNELHAGLEAESGGAGTAGSADIVDFLGEVFARISAHFALEERVMRERAYDEYDAHKDAHEELLEQIRDIMDQYEAGGFEGAVETLGGRLEAWFVDHFRTHDARLHRMLADMGLEFGEI